jgi:hypothetical protein
MLSSTFLKSFHRLRKFIEPVLFTSKRKSYVRVVCSRNHIKMILVLDRASSLEIIFNDDVVEYINCTAKNWSLDHLRPKILI